MLKTAVLAALALACLIVNAEARQRHKTYAAHPDCNVLWPCEGVTASPRGARIVKAMGGFGSAQKVYTLRTAGAQTARKAKSVFRHRNNISSLAARTGGAQGALNFEVSSRAVGITDAIARPIRYIAGRLICAINVNAALAERGIRGTGSALAHSFDGWGIRVAQPIPGAVAVTDRRGGGHVAIVSRVEGTRVFVWNPSPRGRGWQEVEYTNRHARYRVAG